MSIKEDARRYRWIKNAPSLDLRREPSVWLDAASKTKFTASHRLCASGTVFAAQTSLDETIDAAMSAHEKRA